MTPRSVPRDDLIGVIIAAALLSFLAFRITQAADLTDESYYAVFIDDWLKEGIRASPFRVVHQTAALLIYPAARVFRLAMGSTDGLIVFLRSLYVIGAALAALSTAALFWRLGTRLGGWLAGAIVLAFIPYGLPAPSYNTIGEQAMIIALASLGCAILAESSRLLPAISALAWAFATVAYPPLFLALVVLLAFLPTVLRPHRRLQFAYIGLVAGFQLVAWGCVLGVLTWPRMLESIAYQSDLSPMLNVGEKISTIMKNFTQNLFFLTLACTAIALGLIKVRLPQSIYATSVAALIVLLLFVPATLFVRSHDAILLGALTGLGMLGWLFTGANPQQRLLATLFAVSLTAGLVSVATATYVFSFSVCGAFAGILAVLSGSSFSNRWWALPTAALLGVISISSVSFFYGELPGEISGRRQRIIEGPFAGISASAGTADLIKKAHTMLNDWSSGNDTVAVVGRLSGLYLLGKARARVLTPFTLTDLAQSQALAKNDLYYSNPSNRPDIVIMYADSYFVPVNQFGSSFDAWYKQAVQERTSTGILSLFRRRDLTGSSAER